MVHLFSRRSTILLLILLPQMVSLACKGPMGGPVKGTSTTGAPTPEVLTAGGEVVFGPGDFVFPNTQAGLADLPSYKATLIMSFDGTRAGEAEQWSKTYVMLTTKEPVTRQLTIEKTGDLSDLDTVFMAEMDGADYERHGEGICSATVIEPGNTLSERMEPAGFLTGVHGAQAAGDETINDVGADHYTFDEGAFGQLDVAQSAGEIWVASDGGFIVKYVLTTKGNPDFFGEGIEGTLTWEYELTDVNQPITFELPDGCPAGMVDAPLLPDAADIVNMPGLLSFTAATSMAEAIAFYQQKLPALGWQQAADPLLSETTALLDFTQADQQLSVIITTSDGGTTVRIMVEVQP